MENLENIFKQTKGRIAARTEGLQQEKAKELERAIRDIESKLISELSKYRFSSRLQNAIDGEFCQLKECLLKMNNGQMNKMAENAIQSLDRLNREIDEIDEKSEGEEKQTETKKSFNKTKAYNRESRESNEEPKDEQYINDCVEKSFADIVRNINIHINEGGRLALGLDNRAIRNIQEIKQYCYERCKRQVGEVHNSSIDLTSRMIDREIESLESNIMTRENQKKEQVEEKLGPILDNPFELMDEQKAEVNKNIARVTKETIEKNQNLENKNELALPDDVLK